MEPAEFRMRLAEIDIAAPLFVAMRERPLGLFAVAGAGYRVEPHVEWCPWATPRNKIESVLKLLNEVRRKNLGMIWSREEHTPFFLHMCKYGVLRRGCKVLNYFDDGADAMLFYTRA